VFVRLDEVFQGERHIAKLHVIASAKLVGDVGAAGDSLPVLPARRGTNKTVHGFSCPAHRLVRCGVPGLDATPLFWNARITEALREFGQC
jgi:hypothetical protein